MSMHCTALATTRGGDAGDGDDQRDVDVFVVELAGVAPAAVPAEFLAVIRGDDDDGTVEQSGAPHLVEKVADVPIGERYLAVVAVLLPVAVVETRVLGVREVGLAVEEEETERSAGDPSLEHGNGRPRHFRGGEIAGGDLVETGTVPSPEERLHELGIGDEGLVAVAGQDSRERFDIAPPHQGRVVASRHGGGHGPLGHRSLRVGMHEERRARGESPQPRRGVPGVSVHGEVRRAERVHVDPDEVAALPIDLGRPVGEGVPCRQVLRVHPPVSGPDPRLETVEAHEVLAHLHPRVDR